MFKHFFFNFFSWFVLIPSFGLASFDYYSINHLLIKTQDIPSEIMRKWKDNGFKAFSYIDVTKNTFSDYRIRLPMTAFIQSGTWPENEVVYRLERTRNYYQRCGIDLYPIRAVFGHKIGWDDALVAPDQLKGSFNPHGANGLFVIFMKHFTNYPTTGLAGPRYWVKHVFALNTIYMASNTLRYEKEIDTSYDVLSHEVAHVLLDSLHNTISGNVLSESYDGMNITSEQCASIRSHAEEIISWSNSR
jgi:hypothetical protein